MDTTERITAAWREDRAYLLAIASRILADRVEAEDVVQDAFARLAVQEVEDIEEIRGWLVVVVRRLALDRLGSAHHRRTTPRDPLLLPAADEHAPDPADRVTLDDEVRAALGVVLDQLTPAERAAFLLHDVFGVPFDRIAELVGRSSSSCRQLASRARRAIRSDEPRLGRSVRAAELHDVAGRFIAACADGDLEALARVLHPDVSGWATSDGRVVGFGAGATALSERLMFFLGPRPGWTLAPMPLDDGIAVVATRNGDPAVLLRLDIEDGVVRKMHAVVLPA